MADISKIKLNGMDEALNIKDATARQNMEILLGDEKLKALGAAAWKALGEVADGDTGLVTGDQVFDAIASIGAALHFIGIVEKAGGKDEIQSVEAAYPAATQKNGAIAICGVKEFIVYGGKWNEFGDETIYETSAHAANTYVPKTRTIAGVDLANDVTKTELETGLDIKALAHKDEATGSFIAVSSADDISVGKAGTYNVTGGTVSVPKTFEVMDVTAAGTVSVSKSTGAEVKYMKATSATVSGATAKGKEVANFTPAGTISRPNVNASLNLKEAEVATVTSEGTAFTLSDGGVSKGQDSFSTFAKTGLVANLDESDKEMLVFSNATTANAVTASADITYTKQTISGSLPTFGTKSVVIKTGSDVSASLASDPVFTGAGAVLSATLGYSETGATVTDAVYTAGFAGTTKTVTPSIKTSEDVSVENGKVTVTPETVHINLNKTSQPITVS